MHFFKVKVHFFKNLFCFHFKPVKISILAESSEILAADSSHSSGKPPFRAGFVRHKAAVNIFCDRLPVAAFQPVGERNITVSHIRFQIDGQSEENRQIVRQIFVFPILCF